MQYKVRCLKLYIHSRTLCKCRLDTVFRKNFCSMNASLDGEDIFSFHMNTLTGHLQSKLSHSLRSLPRLRLSLGHTFARSVGLLAQKLLFAVLSLPLKTLHNINSTTGVTIRGFFICQILICCSEAGCSVLFAKGIRSPRQRLGVSKAWTRSKWGKCDCPTS